MKLIDLLVKELPKRGGWPEGMDSVAQSSIDGELYFYSTTYDGTGADLKSGYCLDLCDEHFNTSSVLPSATRDQYESALAASQNPAWSGEGLPPAGCECEFISNDTSWGVVRVIGMDDDKVVIKPSGEIYYGITPSNKQVFRPLRTESERKHEAVLESICAVLEMVAQDYRRNDEAKLIYEAIAAGKIPGVKLED